MGFREVKSKVGSDQEVTQSFLGHSTSSLELVYIENKSLDINNKQPIFIYLYLDFNKIHNIFFLNKIIFKKIYILQNNIFSKTTSLVFV